MRTRVRLCGPLALEIDGRDVIAAVPAGQARSLLAYLLTRRERAAERGTLVDVIWPSGAPKDPQADLRVILTRLRRALAPATLDGRQELRLALPAPIWVDAEVAARAVEAARADARDAAWSSALEQARAASALLRPGFLPGQDGGWAQEERQGHEELELEALEWIARSGLALGGAELATAQRAARDLVSHSPFRETGHRLLMEALGATGNVAEALQVYEELRCLLRDELGVTPAPEVQALHQRLLAGEPVRAPVRAVVRAGIAPGSTRYARHGEISLAYQVLGDGPTTLLLVTGWVLPMEAIWEDPAYARFVERLASSFRVILWDKRGTGLSDRVAVDRLPTLEERMDDIGAVLDAAGAERAAIAGLSEGAVLARAVRRHAPGTHAGAGPLWRLGRHRRRRGLPRHAESPALRRVRRRGPALVGRHGLVPRVVGADARARPRRARLVDARAASRREPGLRGRVAAHARRLRHPRRRGGDPHAHARHAPHRRPDDQGRERSLAGREHPRAPSTSSCPATTTCGGSATRTRCSTSSSASSPSPRPPANPIACWRPCSSPTSSTRRGGRARSETADGAISWPATRRSSATGSRVSADRR